MVYHDSRWHAHYPKRRTGHRVLARNSNKKRTRAKMARVSESTRMPVVARFLYQSRNNIYRTFSVSNIEGLDQPAWGGRQNSRYDVLQTFSTLTPFKGFMYMMQSYEMVRIISFTIKAKISKSAYGTAFGNRDNNSVDLAVPPNPTGAAGGSVMTPACFDFCEIRAVVDYDGKDGKGSGAVYDHEDFANSGSASTTSINSTHMKTVARFAPRQWIDHTNVTVPIAVPLSKTTQTYPRNAFIQSNGAPLPSAQQPIFGGCNWAAISYDAAGCGFNGIPGDTNPVLGVQFEYSIKCEFKGAIDAITT